MVWYEEKSGSIGSSNPTLKEVVLGIVKIQDFVNDVVPVTEGYSFMRNMFLQMHTTLIPVRQGPPGHHVNVLKCENHRCE